MLGQAFAGDAVGVAIKMMDIIADTAAIFICSLCRCVRAEVTAVVAIATTGVAGLSSGEGGSVGLCEVRYYGRWCVGYVGRLIRASYTLTILAGVCFADASRPKPASCRLRVGFCFLKLSLVLVGEVVGIFVGVARLDHIEIEVGAIFEKDVAEKPVVLVAFALRRVSLETDASPFQ